MATVLERNGSYRIKVSCGYDIHGRQDYPRTSRFVIIDLINSSKVAGYLL